VKTDERVAFTFCECLFAELSERFADSNALQQRLTEISSHSKHPETLFCKGCVLPIVDSVATRFLSSSLLLGPEQIRAALRCEGISNLQKVYQPGPGQSGFSTYTWGTNYQTTSKSGRAVRSRPCPDFGVVQPDNPKFALLGETKFSRRVASATSLVLSVESDLRYYMSLPSEPEKGWHYDYGFGIAYAAGGAGPRKSTLYTQHWAEYRFVVASFSA
jgi:hypothetical protein